MKKLLFIFTAFLFSQSLLMVAAEKEVESKISTVTVFMTGAQVTGDYNISLPAGNTTLKFTGISSFVDKNSIRVTGQGNFTILSVKHALNYLDKSANQEKTDEIGAKIKLLKNQVETKETELKILGERKDFLVANMSLASDKVVDPANMRLYHDFFTTNFSEVEMKILSVQRELRDLNEQLKLNEQQYQEIAKQKNQPSSEIIVEVTARQETTGSFKVSYVITSAGWYPTYDLRVKDIDSPVQLTYQANVYQTCGMDWKNVELIISNANPGENANLPVLAPYYLNFPSLARTVGGIAYDPSVRQVRGKVIDGETGEPLPFVSITVKDKSVGTASDFDGNFTISIPAGAKFLVFSYVGYLSQEIPISQAYMTVSLNADVVGLQEVVVTSYGISKDSFREKELDEEQSVPLEVSTVQRQTSFEFKIATPYTIESNSGALKIDMMSFEMNSAYVYKTVPKLSERAFLIALISDWEKYDLLDGEINLYYENTFVGKSLLDLSQISDTLEVSLGPDKDISIKRELEKEFTSKQLMGPNKIEKRSWKTIVKNNKSRNVRIIVYDQLPVSNHSDIIVESINTSGVTADADTGIVTWELESAPGETITRSLEYSVKYPKNKILRIQ